MTITGGDVHALLLGLANTLVLLGAAGVGALIFGSLATVARLSPIPLLRGAGFVYVQFFINVPLLVLLVLAVFALPETGLLMPLTPTVMLVLAMYQSAYVSESLRSGVNSVPNGQVEAARALGFSFTQMLRHVVLPQAARSVVQPLGNQLIALTMNTSLAAVVGIVELTARINQADQVHGQPLAYYTLGGLIYLAISLALGLTTGVIERKVAIKR